MEWGHLFLLVVACLALSFAIDQTPQVEDILLSILVIAVVFYALQVALQYLVSVTVLHKLDSNIAVVGISHRRFAAQFHAALIPMLGAAYFRYAFRPGRLAAWARPGLVLLAGYAWMLCIVAASRGAMVALVVSVLVLMAFAGRGNWRPWLKFYGMSLLVGAILVGIFFVWMPELLHAPMTWENRLADKSITPDANISSGRIYLWKEALDLIKVSPWLGAGPMHFSYKFHEEGAHPHNLAIQLAAEWGMIAMLCFVGVLVYGYFCFAKFTKSNLGYGNTHATQTTVQGLLAVLTIIAVYTMIDGLFVMPFSQMWVVFFVAWSMSVMKAGGASNAAVEANADGKGFRGLVAAGLLIALVSVAMFGFPGIGKTKERSAVYQSSGASGLYFPRFWLQGWIGPLPSVPQGTQNPAGWSVPVLEPGPSRKP